MQTTVYGYDNETAAWTAVFDIISMKSHFISINYTWWAIWLIAILKWGGLRKLKGILEWQFICLAVFIFISMQMYLNTFLFFFSTFDFRALCVRVWEGDCERYAKNWDWEKKQLLFTCKSQWALKWAFSFPRRFFNICHVIDLFEPIWMYWKFVELIQLAIADRDTHTHNAKTITGSAYLW